MKKTLLMIFAILALAGFAAADWVGEFEPGITGTESIKLYTPGGSCAGGCEISSSSSPVYTTKAGDYIDVVHYIENVSSNNVYTFWGQDPKIRRANTTLDYDLFGLTAQERIFRVDKVTGAETEVPKPVSLEKGQKIKIETRAFITNDYPPLINYKIGGSIGVIGYLSNFFTISGTTGSMPLPSSKPSINAAAKTATLAFNSNLDPIAGHTAVEIKPDLSCNAYTNTLRRESECTIQANTINCPAANDIFNPLNINSFLNTGMTGYWVSYYKSFNFNAVPCFNGSSCQLNGAISVTSYLNTYNIGGITGDNRGVCFCSSTDCGGVTDIERGGSKYVNFYDGIKINAFGRAGTTGETAFTNPMLRVLFFPNNSFDTAMPKATGNAKDLTAYQNNTYTIPITTVSSTGSFSFYLKPEDLLAAEAANPGQHRINISYYNQNPLDYSKWLAGVDVYFNTARQIQPDDQPLWPSNKIYEKKDISALTDFKFLEIGARNIFPYDVVYYLEIFKADGTTHQAMKVNDLGLWSSPAYNPLTTVDFPCTNVSSFADNIVWDPQLVARKEGEMPPLNAKLCVKPYDASGKRLDGVFKFKLKTIKPSDWANCGSNPSSCPTISTEELDVNFSRPQKAICGSNAFGGEINGNPTTPIELTAGSEIPMYFDVLDAGVSDSASLWDSTITNPFHFAPTMPQNQTIWNTSNWDPAAKEWINTGFLGTVCKDPNQINCLNALIPIVTSPSIVPLKPENGLPSPNTKYFRFVFKIKVPSTTGIYDLTFGKPGSTAKGPPPKFQIVHSNVEWIPADCGASPNGTEGCCGPNSVIVEAMPATKSCTFTSASTTFNKNNTYIATLQYFNFNTTLAPMANTVSCGVGGPTPANFSCNTSTKTCTFTCTYSTITGSPFVLSAKLNDTASPTPVTCINPPIITVIEPVNPTCLIGPIPNISVGQLTTITVLPQNFVMPQPSTSINCGNGSLVKTINCSSGTCTTTCGPYTTASPPDYTVTATFSSVTPPVNCTKTFTVNPIIPPSSGGLVEITGISLWQGTASFDEAVPLVSKNSLLNVNVNVKNGKQAAMQGYVKIKIEPGITQQSPPSQLNPGNNTINLNPITISGLEESKTYTLTVELFNGSGIKLDKQEKSFVVQRTGVNVPEGNPLMAFAALGIVLGIIYFSGKKEK